MDFRAGLGQRRAESADVTEVEESSPGGEGMWGASKRVLSIMMPDLGGEGNRDADDDDDDGKQGCCGGWRE